MRLSTISKIEINKALIGEVLFLRKFLEIFNSIFIQSYRDLLLELFGVRILD